MTKVKTPKITLLEDRVLLKAIPQEDKTKGGIFIPDSAKEKPVKGLVIVAGPGTEDRKVTVKPGDIVLYGKYAGNEIELEGETYLMTRQADIYAIIH